MKKILLPVLMLFSAGVGFSQQYKIDWGEEIKLKKGTADLDIIMADKTGLFLLKKEEIAPCSQLWVRSATSCTNSIKTTVKYLIKTIKKN